MWNSGRTRSRRHELIVIALLVSAVAVVYGPVGNHEFINFDDPGYVFDNAHVRKGLTSEGFEWAFTTRAQSNWHPLTWLSHMLDVECFGVEGRFLGLPASGWHHLTNVCLHAGNSVLLFIFLRAATRTMWRSAAVAALFALHPLHVESVAWASERKEVLSTVLGFACLLAYVRYARCPSTWRYLLVFALLALGLMAKPMLVTWPFLMLLLDGWPLGRWKQTASSAARSELPRRLWFLVLEKVPLFALAAASSVATFVSQRPAMYLMEVVPIGLRVQNASVACLTYVAKTFWPTRLAILYPYRHDIPGGLTALALLFLVAFAATALWNLRRRPYLTVGGGWFLGTLIPVIGLVQVGLHARADRYTYVPLVGVFIVVVWAAAEAGARWYAVRRAVPLAVIACIAACAAATAGQVRYWSDTETLFQHTCDVTTDNGWAHRILGAALADKGRTSEAIREYRQALGVWPGDPVAHNNLGAALQAQGRFEDALREYQEAVHLDPLSAAYHRNLGRMLSKAGRLDEADHEFSEAERVQPAAGGSARDSSSRARRPASN